MTITRVRDAIRGLGTLRFTPGGLAGELGCSDRTAWSALAQLEARGDVVPAGGRAMTLSPRGAARLRLRNDGRGWAGPEDLVATTPAAVDLRRSRAILREWGGEVRRDPEGNPHPTILIGIGSPPGVGDDGSCPACGGWDLPANGYCLDCDRWGLETPRRQVA